MSKWKYLVGWCPNCGNVVVVAEDDDPRCGCATPLMYKTCCADADDIAAAVRQIKEKTEGAFESRPLCSVSLEEEAAAAKAAARAMAEEDGEDTFDAMGDLLCMMLGGDCSTCPLGGDEEDTEEDELGRGEAHEFAVVPSPYRIWARGESYDEALDNLREHIGEFALAGFKVAMEAGDIEFTVVPVDAEGGVFKAAKRGDA